ncbi:alpha-hydroxy acid oxidase [Streptomyces violaceoruber]|uniref:Glycolate oxidase n=3 Tax=Streptomyces TaxID=1883 RepID=A0ABM5R4D2_STRLI|nr:MULTISPECIES: alpha-hydroxy acid oxidase [Streptomyces]QSJ10813.1 glycolate oxidase [Streptomyces lividans]AIJ15246.1 glycolate oxidase [Streptomyces lividans TK24]EFD68670.1 glycolate oxidase [Streptomyces lividans TK24]KKD11775.1 2-hydroxy-acid oxidase [Streptomyces sp. WM6391]MCW8118429.1 alpha-hydroxy-acid oxidizing protein [Streptomyces anthocyanicus]
MTSAVRHPADPEDPAPADRGGSGGTAPAAPGGSGAPAPVAAGSAAGGAGAGAGVREPLTLDDFARLARGQLPAATWDFIAGGAGRERTLAANEAVFGAVRLRPRALPGIEEPDTSVEVLGSRWPAPVGIAPVAYHGLAHPDGEPATAAAAGALGLPLVVSTFAGRSLEEVAHAASAPLWLQLYCFRDHETTLGLARRARDSGYQALVLTVDTPFTGRRLRDLRNGFAVPAHIIPANLTGTAAAGSATPGAHSRLAFDRRLDWSFVARLGAASGLPVLAKGVLTAPDAEAAVAAGVAGIVVSNHGGRQLDGAPATLEALPEVVSAVRGRCPVLLDGGVRTGADVLAALALGARAVLVGRPALYALAVGGAAGVRRMLTLLTEDFADTMVLTGHAATGTIGPDTLAPPHHAPPHHGPPTAPRPAPHRDRSHG